MSWDRDRKLDAAGIVLGVAVLLSIGLLAFGTAQVDSGADQQPDVEWSLDRVDDNHVRIAHDGGEPLYAEELSMTVDGRERPTPFEGTIRSGDSATVPVSEGMRVRLHWTGGTGERELMHSERP